MDGIRSCSPRKPPCPTRLFTPVLARVPTVNGLNASHALRPAIRPLPRSAPLNAFPCPTSTCGGDASPNPLRHPLSCPCASHHLPRPRLRSNGLCHPGPSSDFPPMPARRKFVAANDAGDESRQGAGVVRRVVRDRAGAAAAGDRDRVCVEQLGCVDPSERVEGNSRGAGWGRPVWAGIRNSCPHEQGGRSDGELFGEWNALGPWNSPGAGVPYVVNVERA